MKDRDTIIIIPTYNERDNIEPLIAQIYAALPRAIVQIVDDSSPDGTADEVRRLQEKYSHLELLLREKKEGLGAAYVDAFRRVLSGRPAIRRIIMMDADLTHNPKDLPRMLSALDTCDFAIGDSLMGGMGRKEYPFYRNVLSVCANWYCSMILGERHPDWTNAYIAIHTDVLRTIEFGRIAAKEYAFLFGLKYALLRKGFRVAIVPSPVTSRMRGASKIQLSTIIEAAIFPWKLRRQF